MATRIAPSKIVLAARVRRKARAGRDAVRVQSFVEKVVKNTQLTIRQRVTLVTAMVKDKVVRNISVPVGKGTRAISKWHLNRAHDVIVIIRSKPGEFPRAETSTLRRTIFDEVLEVSDGHYEGYVGTPLDYGLILELVLDRSFLTRTLQEELDTVMRIVRPI